MKKYTTVLLVVLLLIAAIFVLPVSAAEQEQVNKGIQVAKDAAKMTFPTDGTATIAVCPVCNVKTSWIPLGQENFETAGYRLESGKHYYLKESVEGNNARILAPELSGHEGCIHLNGKTVTSTHSSSTTISGSAGQLNIMGDGNVVGGASGGATLGSTIHINTSGRDGSVNLYGGTYSKRTPSGNTNVISIRTNGGTVNIYAGATIQGGTDGSALFVNGESTRVNAVINIYGGTIDGSASSETAVDIRAEGTSGNSVQCNLYAGKILGSSAGSVELGKGSDFAVYGGTISGGKLTANGNFLMYGGTVDGQDTAISVEADASGYLLGGKVTHSDITVVSGGKFYLGGNGIARNIRMQGQLLVCDGWKGNASVEFDTAYAPGAVIPTSIARVVTLQENLAETEGGSFTGRLEQGGAALCAKADGSLYVAGMLLVAADGTQTEAADALTQWAEGDYAYIKLCADAAFSDLKGLDVTVDLNGFDLTVGGNGKLQLLDSANDNFDADLCGRLTNTGTVEVAEELQMSDGRRYVVLSDGNQFSAHRIEMVLTAVTLRMQAAGLYYKAAYHCDREISQRAVSYGVVMSLANMPGEDFLLENADNNCYTEETQPLQYGAVATSGSVFNIMKEAYDSQTNAARGEMRIYANPYIRLDLGGGKIFVGDTKNPGKTTADADFDGIACSLRSVMEDIESNYYTYNAEERGMLDEFYAFWKDKGMDWGFANIGGSTTITNENLSFAEGTNDAWCEVCEKTVTWTPVTQATHGETAIGTDTKEKHYYLAEDITYTGAATFIQAPSSSSACLHLNGNDLISTSHRAIMGYAGTLNVLGNGNVEGYTTKANGGSAVHINTNGKNGKVNLYGGTYREYVDNDAVAVGIGNNGGQINIYEGATVSGAVYVGTSNLIDSVIGVYGGKVTSTITFEANGGKGFATRLATSGQAELKKVVTHGTTEVSLSGAPRINLLDLDIGTPVTVSGLAKGCAVTIRGTGAFADVGDRAEEYASYFKAYFTADSIVAKDGILVYETDYTEYLSPWETDVIAQAKEDGKIHYYFMASEKLWLRKSHNNEKWGDSCLVVFPDGQTMLVDSGYQDMGPLIWRNLQRMGVTKLDHLVISHPHTDHYGGAFGITVGGNRYVETGFLEQIEVERVYINGLNFENDNGHELIMHCCEKYDIPVTVLKPDDTLTVGGVKLEVLWPDMEAVTSNMTDLTKDVNDTSLVIRMDYGEHSALFTGDLYVRGEGWLLDAIDDVTKLDVDFLKIPHHGRNTSSSAAFVNAVTPDLAVFTGRAAQGQVDEVYAAANAILLNDEDHGYIHVSAEVNGEMTYKSNLSNGKISENKEALDKKKIIFFGNSYTFYGKCVLDKGQTVFSQEARMNDEGYFYQICKANGIDVNVTNFTFGVHNLKDFHPTGCAADRGHDGRNHLADITDFHYDYVVLQPGSADLNCESLLAECEMIVKPFREANPDVKVIFLANHIEYLLNETEQFKNGYKWRSDIKKLAEAGILVVDWGSLVCDLMYGRTEVPGATQQYGINSFIISQSATDGYHQNMLTGYITALMTYCAITGESAQDQPCFFADERFNVSGFAAYRTKYYSYINETNFDAILCSKADLAGIQQLIDRYMEARTYLNY